MPDFTIASAIPRTSWSLTSQPNLFHVFHPMGGVIASPADTEVDCANMVAGNWKGSATARITARSKCFFMVRLEASDHHTAEYLKGRDYSESSSATGKFWKRCFAKSSPPSATNFSP